MFLVFLSLIYIIDDGKFILSAAYSKKKRCITLETFPQPFPFSAIVSIKWIISSQNSSPSPYQ